MTCMFVLFVQTCSFAPSDSCTIISLSHLHPHTYLENASLPDGVLYWHCCSLCFLSSVDRIPDVTHPGRTALAARAQTPHGPLHRGATQKTDRQWLASHEIQVSGLSRERGGYSSSSSQRNHIRALTGWSQIMKDGPTEWTVWSLRLANVEHCHVNILCSWHCPGNMKGDESTEINK